MSKCFSSENILLKENWHLNLEEFHRLIIEKSGIKNSPIFNFNNYFNISIKGFSSDSTKKVIIIKKIKYLIITIVKILNQLYLNQNQIKL